MLLCIRLCALRFVLVCALTFVLSDVCSHVLSYVLPYALICVLSFVLVNLHSHICALVCILSYLCSHLCAPSFLPRDAMFHLFLFTLFGVPCRCNFRPSRGIATRTRYSFSHTEAFKATEEFLDLAGFVVFSSKPFEMKDPE